MQIHWQRMGTYLFFLKQRLTFPLTPNFISLTHCHICVVCVHAKFKNRPSMMNNGCLCHCFLLFCISIGENDGISADLKILSLLITDLFLIRVPELFLGSSELQLYTYYVTFYYQLLRPITFSGLHLCTECLFFFNTSKIERAICTHVFLYTVLTGIHLGSGHKLKYGQGLLRGIWHATMMKIFIFDW